MRNQAPLAEPGPHRKARGEESTRYFWKPMRDRKPVPAEAGPLRPLPVSMANVRVAYLLAPRPWPQGQFRIDPEA